MRRATIVLDDENNLRLVELQSKLIARSKSSINFSRVINMVIVEGLKHFKAGEPKK